MPKFFVNKNQISENTICILDEDASHLINVLRCKLGDSIVVCDGKNNNFICNIVDIGKKSVGLNILETSICESEPNVKITLFQAMPKSDKMELIIQKCVEIGIHSIIPVITENISVKIKDNFDKKIERYNKISEAAAKQSGRGIIPEIKNIISFKEAIETMLSFDKSFVAYEKQDGMTLKSCIKDLKATSIGIFIGPEGGFSKEEIMELERKNIKIISLGKRILRTETAGIMFLSILLYEMEEI